MRAPIRCALAFAVTLGLAPGALADAALVSVSGTVEIGSGSPPSWRAAQAGDTVKPGDAIRTGASSRAELRLGDERLARLYERSLLRIGPDVTAQGSVRSVALDEGTSLFDLVRRAVVEEFDVRTPEIVVSVKGTRFLVEASPGPDLASVFRGEVSLSGQDFDEIAIHPGFTGALGEVQQTPFVDPWDSWAAGGLAPQHVTARMQDAELHGAVKAARDAVDAAPASRDPEASDDSTEKGKADEKPQVDDTLLQSVEKGVSNESLLDGVVDVAGENAKREASSGSSDLLTTVLRGEDTVFPFTFDVETSGGPNTVTVSFGGKSVTLDQNAIDTVLSGSMAPFGGLNGAINSLGVDPVALATYLDSLI